MLTYDQRQNIKRIPITSYLAGKECFPVLQTGGEYCYFSPFKDERTPSFFVNAAQNIYKDFSTDEKGGDNIRLVQKLDQVDFFGAIKILQNVDDSFEIELQANLPASPQYQSFIKKIVPLESFALKNYIYRERYILPGIAKRELSEIHYRTSKGDFFSIGFKSRSGGWELRNPSFKGCIGKKDISVRGTVAADVAIIFEGFIDYLSFLSMAENKPLEHNMIIILNSLSLVSQLPDLSEKKMIILYLDNDDAGKLAAMKLCDKYDKCFSGSKQLFPQFKDYNEFLKSRI